MPETKQAHLVSLASFTMMEDGRHCILTLKHSDGTQTFLAIPTEEAPVLIAAGATMASDARRRVGTESAPPFIFRIDSWSTKPKPNDEKARLLSITTSGFELCFEVTDKTLEGGASRGARHGRT